jgi:hypothetical protein
MQSAGTAIWMCNICTRRADIALRLQGKFEKNADFQVGSAIYFVLVEHFRMFSVLHRIFALRKIVKQLKIESYEKIIDSSFKFGYFQHSGNGR